MLQQAWVSNSDRISATLQDKLPMIVICVYFPNQLDNTVVGDDNLCPKRPKNNTIFSMRRTVPSGHAPFDFVDMLKNESYGFSANLDVKSDVQSNDDMFNDSNKYLSAIGSSVTDDLIDDDNRGGNINTI